MEQLCSTQQVSVSNSSSPRELDTRQTEVREPVAGLEKMDHIKTTQADCKWAWEQTARSGAGAEWRWLGEARSQQASDQTLRFNISNHSHCLEPQRGYYGILQDFFSSLTLFVTDSYLHWLTLRELAARWEGGRQANWLSSSWLMAGFGRKNGRPRSPPPFFSVDSLEVMNPVGMFWQRCMDSASQFSLCLFPWMRRCGCVE